MIACTVPELPEEGHEDEAVDFGFAAEDVGDVLFDVLAVFDKSFAALLFLSGDNASVNVRLSDLITRNLRESGVEKIVPLIGCASHRLNLAVKAYIKANYKELMEEVHALMADLRTMKNRYKLRVHTKVRPEIENDTRWMSSLPMLTSFDKLYPILQKCGLKPKTLELIPSAAKKYQLDELRNLLLQINEVNLELQKSDSIKINLAYIRDLFDGLIELCPSLASHLAKDAAVVANPSFESGIVKIQNQKENRLTESEKRACERFLRPVQTGDDLNDDSEDAPRAEVSFVERIRSAREEQENKRIRTSSKYVDTRFASGTSNICEQLFSKAKHIMTPTRRRMDPSTLEGILLLKINSDLWDAELVQEILDDEEAERKNKTPTSLESISSAGGSIESVDDENDSDVSSEVDF